MTHFVYIFAGSFVQMCCSLSLLTFQSFITVDSYFSSTMCADKKNANKSKCKTDDDLALNKQASSSGIPSAPKPPSSTGASSASKPPSSPSSEIRSLSSQQSLGFELSAFDRNSLGNVTRLHDVVQMAILCRQHRAILLTPVLKSTGLYLPFSIFKPGMYICKQSWIN